MKKETEKSELPEMIEIICDDPKLKDAIEKKLAKSIVKSFVKQGLIKKDGTK